MAKDFLSIPVNIVSLPDVSGGQTQTVLNIQIPPGEGTQQGGFFSVQVASSALGTMAAGAATLHLLQ